MQPIRFLMIASAYPPMKKAGMERACQRTSEALARGGHPVTVLTQRTHGEPALEEAIPALRVLRVLKPLAFGPLWGITYMEQVRRWTKKLLPEFDVCIFHKLYLHSVAATPLCRRAGKPTANILYNAGAFSDIKMLREHKAGEHLLRLALEADASFYLSNVSKAELLAEGLPPERLHRFRMLTDMGQFRPSEEIPRREFLYLGRFHPQKNIPLLLKAFEQVVAEEPEARLRLVGRGSEEERVRGLWEASPARDRISIEEWTDDAAAAYQQAWAVVTASDAEGLSNVLVETLACGTPAITTDVSGAHDVLDPRGLAPGQIPAGEHHRASGGLIVPIGDAPALADAMLRLYRDDDLRAQLAAQARCTVDSTYSEEACVKEFLAAVRSMMERKPA